jgi:hypothetical protein
MALRRIGGSGTLGSAMRTAMAVAMALRGYYYYYYHHYYYYIKAAQQCSTGGVHSQA